MLKWKRNEDLCLENNFISEYAEIKDYQRFELDFFNRNGKWEARATYYIDGSFQKFFQLTSVSIEDARFEAELELVKYLNEKEVFWRKVMEDVRKAREEK